MPEPEAAYVYAMAEKRAKDRVILRLIGLPEVVSSEEALAGERRPSASNENTPAANLDREPGFVGELTRKLAEAETVEAVVALMRAAETQQSLAELAPEWTDELRAYAKARLVALGWTPKKVA